MSKVHLEKVPVRFVKHYSRFNPGEVAGFAADRAEKLIEAGVAVATEGFAPNITAKAKSTTKAKGAAQGVGKETTGGEAKGAGAPPAQGAAQGAS